MLLAMNRIIGGKEYYHDPEIRNKEGKTVCFYIWKLGAKVPEYW